MWTIRQYYDSFTVEFVSVVTERGMYRTMSRVRAKGYALRVMLF